MALLDQSRCLSLVTLLSLAAATSAGCALARVGDEPTDDGAASSTDDITEVDHSSVKRQSIGNCWIYATSSWLEALDKAATNQEVNTSESWLTYWHWFEQIANGSVGEELNTGGEWTTAADIILRYGITTEGNFIPSEADDEMSMSQENALNAMNASLKTGALKDPAARRDRKLVRSELDKAWGLEPAVVAKLNTVFGEAVDKTLDRAYVNQDPGNGIIRATDFKARLKDPQSGQFVTGTLADALGTRSGWSERTGKFAWNQTSYPSDAQSRRAFWKRAQQALHDHQPVLMSWRVDFNALTRDSVFSLQQLKQLGPGRQGGHMTVMHDYQADVPGIGILKAGVDATPEQEQAALSDDTKILFVRVKNSWGGIRPDRWDNSILPGYHDLDMDYLNGPITECPETEGPPDPSTCSGQTVPLWDIILPAGY